MLKIVSTNNQQEDIQGAKRFYFKAQDALKAGKWIKAIQYLKKSLEINKDYQPACRDLAEIYHQHGDLEEAQRYIETSLQINPDDPISLFIQGVIYLTQRDVQSALKSFNMVLEHGELTWALAYNLGLCYYSLNNYDFSIQYLNKAIQKDPLQAQPYLLLAQIFLIQSKSDMAKEILMRVKKMRPHDRQLHILLNNILNPQNGPRG